MTRLRSFLFMLVAIVLYGLSRPSFFIPEGIPKPWNYLAPFLELISLSLFINIILQCLNWKQRFIYSFVYTFSCQALLYYAGIFFTIERLLPADPIYQHAINIFLIGYNHFHLILWGVLLIPWAITKLYRWLIVGLVMTIWEYYIPTILVIPVGQTWIEFAPHLKMATIFGFPVFGLFQYFFAGVIQKKQGVKLGLFASVLFVLVNYNDSEGIPTPYRIALTHMSLEPRGVLVRERGADEMRAAYLEELVIGAPQKSDFDFWLIPESAWPLLVTDELDVDNLYSFFLDRNLTKTSFAIGITRQVTRNEYLHVKNSFLIFNSQGERTYYDKIKLMPFSETSFLGLKDEFIADIVGKKDFNIAGSNYPLMRLENGATFISTICSEVSHLGFVQNYINKVESKPDFIINGANDKWFTPSNIPLLHFIMNRWMAVSFELPVVRATIGGISGFIAYDGQVGQITNQDKTTVLVDHLISKKNSSGEKNIYSSYGIIPILFLSSLLAPFFYILDRKKRGIYQ